MIPSIIYCKTDLNDYITGVYENSSMVTFTNEYLMIYIIFFFTNCELGLKGCYIEKGTCIQTRIIGGGGWGLWLWVSDGGGGRGYRPNGLALLYTGSCCL